GDREADAVDQGRDRHADEAAARRAALDAETRLSQQFERSAQMHKPTGGTFSDAPPETSLADTARRLKAIFIGSAGNLVEWYDFYAYAAFALYFAGSFFPGTDPVVQQLNAALLFAVGFIVRPIGGWLLGRMAVHYGRRRVLVISEVLMCFGSLLIAINHTYAAIGI